MSLKPPLLSACLYFLPAALCLCLLPTVYCLLSTACCLLLSSNLNALPSNLYTLLSSKDEIDCTPEGVQFQSYHVHVLFWQNNRNSTAAALKLQGQFMEAFGLGLADKCQFSPSATMPDADMCYFQVSHCACCISCMCI
jgi:hypothetical protein